MLACLRAGQHDGQADDVGSIMTCRMSWVLPLAHAEFSEGGKNDSPIFSH